MPAIERFENYEVLHRDDGSVFELGRGAMGVTYKARDTDLHCDVALKVINPGILGSPDARERFMREARAAAQLRHPNIASVFRLGKSADDTHFYAMEFCEGPTLEQAVAKRGPLPTLEALRIALQVSDALMLAEDHRLLHRDLKPANLILTARRSEGTVVKVIDFGLAKSFADGSQTLASHGTGGFVGTAHFASPEQLEEHDLDIRSDIYSLGVCLWFMLDGRPPFAGSLARVMSQTLSSDPPWERLAAQPPVVLDLLRRMLAKNPDDRPATAAELRGEIEECIRAMGSAVPGSEFSGGPAVANRALEEWEFAIRYPMSEEVGRDALGRIFRAADENHGGATVAVRIIDAALIAVPVTRRELEAQIATARAHPHCHLIALLDHAFSSHGLCVATEWLEGFSLIELLKQRGALAPGEVVQLLAPLAAAADHAASHGIRGLNFAKEQIVIHFPATLDAAGRTRVLGTPLDEWPRHLVKAGTLSLGDSGPIGEGTLASTATMAPAAGTRGVALPAVSSVAHVACELLGGRGGEAFAPLPRLSEAGNAVLRRAFTETRAFPNATAFIEALRATVGNPPATSAPRTTTIPPAQVPLPPSRWKAIAAATLIVLTLAGATVGYYYGIHQPRERERERRVANAEGTGKNPVAMEKPSTGVEAHRVLLTTEQQRSEDERKRQEEAATRKPSRPIRPRRRPRRHPL